MPAPMIEWNKYPGGFWFRIYGIGLSVVNRNINKILLYSIRNGGRTIRIGKYTVTYLPRTNRK